MISYFGKKVLLYSSRTRGLMPRVRARLSRAPETCLKGLGSVKYEYEKKTLIDLFSSRSTASFVNDCIP